MSDELRARLVDLTEYNQAGPLPTSSQVRKTATDALVALNAAEAQHEADLRNYNACYVDMKARGARADAAEKREKALREALKWIEDRAMQTEASGMDRLVDVAIYAHDALANPSSLAANKETK